MGFKRVSYTKIRDWKRCRNMYKYKHDWKLTPKAAQMRPESGTYMHELLRAHYKNENWVKASEAHWRAKTKGMLMEERNQYADMRHEVEVIFQRYLDEYKERDKEWNIWAVEEPFGVFIPANSGRNSQTKLYGILDLVAEEKRTGTVWLWDHKYTSRDFDSFESSLELDEQANYYLWGMQQLLRLENINSPIAGIMFNLIRAKVPTQPKLLAPRTKADKDAGRSPGISQAKDIDTTAELYMKAILDNGFDPKDYEEVLSHLAVRDKPFFKRLPIVRTEHNLTLIGKELYQTSLDMRSNNCMRNSTKDCSWDCPFHELCIMEFKGADYKFYADVHFDRRVESK